jgi:hypothetical protein
VAPRPQARAPPADRWHHTVIRFASDESRRYLPLTEFNPDDPNSFYSVEITAEQGVVVYSECCAEAMSEDTARKVHATLGAWLEDRTRDLRP